VVGSRILWLGRIWTVDRINYHPMLGDFYALTAEDDGAFELISARGCDGNFEILADGVNSTASVGAVTHRDKFGRDLPPAA
jgi:hypothetical protein